MITGTQQGITSPSAQNGSVAARSPALQAHVQRLAPIKYCLDPDVYLEEATETLFPQCCLESKDGYRSRLSRVGTSFAPYYAKLRDLVVGFALRNPSMLPEGASPEWKSFLDAVSLAGESFDAFARRTLSLAVDGGFAGILVDYPSASKNLSVAEEKALGYRPYFVAIEAERVLAYRTTVAAEKVNGETVYGIRITHLRIQETICEPDPADEFNDLAIPAVSVYDLVDAPSDSSAENTTQVRYRQFVLRDPSVQITENTSPHYVVETDTTLSIPLIPFVPCYGSVPGGFLQCKPLLLDIARLNLNHWQSSADLAHTLSLTATPTFVISGTMGTEPIQTDRALMLDDPSANGQWQGAPVDGALATMKRLEALEYAMQSLAAVAMSRKLSTSESAEAKLLDAAQSDTLMGVIVSGLEDSMNRALAIAASYKGWAPVRVDLSRDFTANGMDAAMVKTMADLHVSGLISHETLLASYQHGEVFDGLKDWSVEEELELVSKERASLDNTAAGLAIKNLDDPS